VFFEKYTRRSNSKVFTTSIYEISRILVERTKANKPMESKEEIL